MQVSDPIDVSEKAMLQHEIQLWLLHEFRIGYAETEEENKWIDKKCDLRKIYPDLIY